MKNKILIFIIGILVGAIIATAVFLIYSKTTQNSSQPEINQMGGENGQMQNPQSNGNSSEEPPEMPEDSSNTNS